MVKVRERADGRREIRETINRERRSFYGKTKKEVREKDHAALAAPEKEDKPKSKTITITVREFFRQYDEVARDTMRRRSLETYSGIVRKHLLPSIGSVKLSELDRERVQRIYSRKRDAGL